MSDVEAASAAGSRPNRDRKSANYTVPDHMPEEDEVAADEEGEGEEDDGDEEVYIVEKILNHRFERGVLKFEVKWEGYEKKSDRTWEPEENLAEASEILREYYESVGGKEKILEESKSALKTKKRGRPSRDSTEPSTSKKPRKNSEHPRNTSPPATAKRTDWKPPAGSWEDDVADLDACEDEDSGNLMVYITWKNGQKTQHPTSVIYRRCPQKMLQFYERHVRIIKRTDDDAIDTNSYK
jgi:chromobox protein 1